MANRRTKLSFVLAQVVLVEFPTFCTGNEVASALAFLVNM